MAVSSELSFNEVCINLRKKAGYDETQLTELIKSFYENYTVIEMSKPVLLNASQLRQRFGFSFWDGLIVAAAESSGAIKLYSEDMYHGLAVNSILSIEDPFLS